MEKIWYSCHLIKCEVLSPLTTYSLTQFMWGNLFVGRNYSYFSMYMHAF